MKRVLVVDDEPDTLGVFKSVLEGAGFKVMTASNGNECLKTLEKEKVDLVLLDIIMPKMSCWEVFRIIRKRHKKQKVAFLSTVEVSQERKTMLMKEGLADYIMKPFTKQELVEKAKAIV